MDGSCMRSYQAVQTWPEGWLGRALPETSTAGLIDQPLLPVTWLSGTLWQRGAPVCGAPGLC